jgi:hypothetical protein
MIHISLLILCTDIPWSYQQGSSYTYQVYENKIQKRRSKRVEQLNDPTLVDGV